MEEKYVSVSNLTLSLWLDYVKPAFGSDTAPANIADEISHCMTTACFNVNHAIEGHENYTRAEAIELLYQLAVSIKYRHATSDAMLDLHAGLVKVLTA